MTVENKQKVKSKDSDNAKIWVARLQLKHGKSIAKKNILNWGQGANMSPFHFGIPISGVGNRAFGHFGLTGTKLGQNQQIPPSITHLISFPLKPWKPYQAGFVTFLGLPGRVN